MSDSLSDISLDGERAKRSDYRPLVAPAAATPQVQCLTFLMSDVERSWRSKWPLWVVWGTFLAGQGVAATASTIEGRFEPAVCPQDSGRSLERR